MEHRMGQNGTVAERAVGDEGVQATNQQCTDVPSVRCGTLACGHGMNTSWILVSHSRASGKCDADADRPNPAEAATASAPSLQ